MLSDRDSMSDKIDPFVLMELADLARCLGLKTPLSEEIGIQLIG